MKIIQSFWSRPCNVNSQEDVFARRNGGWINEKFHAMSWAFSCLKFKQFYKEVDLYTDHDGYSWLINKIGLPYSNVILSADQLTNADPSLWALSKINTFLTQQKPFLHADGDIFIWKPFQPSFLTSPVFAQNIEFDLHHCPRGNIYIQTLERLERNDVCLPPFLKNSIDQFKNTGRFEAFNMGIVGGQDHEFFVRYAKCVFDFLDLNSHIAFTGKDMNFIEQFFLYSLAKEDEVDVKVLYGPEHAVAEQAYTVMTQFDLVPIARHYIHLVGAAKRQNVACEQLAQRLQYEFPGIYKHIESIYEKNASSRGRIISKPDLDAGINTYFKNSLRILRKITRENSGNTIFQFISFVESVIQSYQETTDLLLLSDVFQFESFVFVHPPNHRQKPFNTLKHQHRFLKLLYETDRVAFLNIKFTLNIQHVGILSVNFKYPQLLNLKKLEGDLAEIASDPVVGDLLLVTESSDFMLNTKIIKDADFLLCFFEDSQITGYELIGHMKSGNLDFMLSEMDSELFAIAFISKYALQHPYLVPVNPSRRTQLPRLSTKGQPVVSDLVNDCTYDK